MITTRRLTILALKGTVTKAATTQSTTKEEVIKSAATVNTNDQVSIAAVRCSSVVHFFLRVTVTLATVIIYCGAFSFRESCYFERHETNSVLFFVQVQYLLQLAAQQGAINQLQTQQSTLATAGGQQIQIIPAGGGAPQTIQLATSAPQNFLTPQVRQLNLFVC